MPSPETIAIVNVPPAGRRRILPELLAVWEASVRASHAFLAEEDIAEIRPAAASAALAVPTLVLAQGSSIAGFMGVCAPRLEMLFLRPDMFRLGIGARLVRHAVERLGVQTVDCNEQNPSALAFYLKQGFRIEGRSARDDAGRPFPLLHLRLGSPAAGRA